MNELIKMFELHPMLKHEFIDTHESLPIWFRKWIEFKAFIIKLFRKESPHP